METTQGLPIEPSAVALPDGGQIDTSAGVASPQVDSSAVPSDATQGGEQGAVEPVQATPDDVLQRQIQSTVDRERAKWQAEAYQREMQWKQQQEFLMKQVQSQTQPVQQNPYDMQTQFPDWQRFEMQSYGKQLLSEAKKTYQEEMQQMVQQANEMTWINQHQLDLAKAGISVDHIKAYNRMNGIPDWNLDIGWKLMNMPSVVANVARQTNQNAINTIRQPQTGASPIRGASPALATTPKFSYEKLALEYQQNPRVFDSWDKGLQDAFMEETNSRRYNMRAPGDRNA